MMKCKDGPIEAAVEKATSQRGFTLIEVMVTLIVALVIMGGLMFSFVKQNSEYTYQNKRIDVVQDLEFGVKFIEEDLRGALVGSMAITIINSPNNLPNDPYTIALSFFTWSVADSNTPGTNALAQRMYVYDPAAKTLSYDREIAGGLLLNPREILSNVTLFKVFDDSVTSTTASRSAVYSDMPEALPGVSIKQQNALLVVPGYTVLIEVEMASGVGARAGIHATSLVDVLGNQTDTKRVWRYTQVYPMAAL